MHSTTSTSYSGWILRMAILTFAAAVIPACQDTKYVTVQVPTQVFDLFVDAVNGNDANPGTQAAPLKSITAALGLVIPGRAIKVAPGLYDVSNGETFPLTIPVGVLLVGDEINKGAGATPTAIIENLGSYLVLPPDDSVIAGFTMTNTNGSFGAIHIMNADRVVIRNCSVMNSNFGIRMDVTDSSELVDNDVEGNNIGISTDSSEILTIRGCNVSDNAVVGLSILARTGPSSLAVERNTFLRNVDGVSIQSSFDSGSIDLGGGSAGSVGQNTFSCNTGNDVYCFDLTIGPLPSVTVHALNNMWDHVPPSGSDITNTAPAVFTVITTGAALAPNPCP